MIFNSAEPSIAGRVPVNCPAGRLVRFVPEPLKLAAVIIPEVFTLAVDVNAEEIPEVVAYPATVAIPAVVAYVAIPALVA